MKEILTLNPISDRIYDHLSKEEYSVSAQAKEPEGILVRSADMHEFSLPKSVMAVARAGAGTNNIPCAEYALKGVTVSILRAQTPTALPSWCWARCCFPAAIFLRQAHGWTR